MSVSIDWPIGLPYPLLGGAVSTAEGRIMSSGDVALTERVINPNYRQTLPVSFLFSNDELQAFKGWYLHYLHDGVNWFNVNWCEDKPGIARFVKPYSTVSSGKHWSVSTEVEVDYAVS